MKRLILLIFISIISYPSVFSQGLEHFKNPQLTIQERIEDLISQLSIEEKAAMLQNNSPSIERLGIPAYNWWNESLHGVGRAGKATVFPQAIGLAASFDEDLIFRVASAISDEARAKFNAAHAIGSTQQYTGLSFWSPNVNIFRDPRWGRGQETYGEDPYLTSRIGVNYIKGLQGNDPQSLKTSACAKHFVVHSGPESSRHSFKARPSDIDFNETYLPAFKALVDAGVETVMCAYNQVYDQPCCGSDFLLQDILRNQWQFKGHIVTDCGALHDFFSHQDIAENSVEAAAIAAKSGVNLNCGGVYGSLPEAVKLNLISEEEVNEVLRPLLATRFKLGLLDEHESSIYANLDASIINSEKHQQLAYEAAAKSIVLLKNDNDVLPLTRNSLQKIFVTGPTANDNTVLLGNYNGYSGNLVTLLEGVINKANPGTVVDYSMGTLLNTKDVYHGLHHARTSDVIIASIGNSRLLEGEEGDAMLSESGGDRADIKLPENQIEFIRKLRKEAPNKPLIIVINGGSAVAIPVISELADVVLMAWYPGEQGGNAIADVVFGAINPSGKLPITFYSSLSDLPAFDNYSMANRTYRYFTGTPLFAFGHGLSYSTFNYADLEISRNKKSAEVLVKMLITNNSNRDAEEVVQLYVEQPESVEFKPVKSLRGFQRIQLNAGESKEVTLTLQNDDFEAWSTEADGFRKAKGEYILQVGRSSQDIRLTGRVKNP